MLHPVKLPRVAPNRHTAPVLAKVVAAGYALTIKAEHANEALALWLESKGLM